MTPRVRGELVARGLVGREILPEQAREMAGIAARNAMAAIGAAIGGTDRIVRCLQLTVYVAAAPGFTEYSSVADGASTALLTALGDGGTAARTAVGVAGLPAGAPVEVALTAAVHLPQNRAG